MHAQSHTAVVFVGVLFTQERHCLLIYPYLAVDTFHELQDTLEHPTDAKAKQIHGLEKVIGEDNALGLQETSIIAREEGVISGRNTLLSVFGYQLSGRLSMRNWRSLIAGIGHNIILDFLTVKAPLKRNNVRL